MPANGSVAEVRDMQGVIERAKTQDKIAWPDLLRLARWRELTAPEEEPKRTLASRHYSEILEIFKKERGGVENVNVALFPPVGGVFILADGTFQLTIRKASITFDWSESQPLLPRIDHLAEQAKDWWPSISFKQPRKWWHRWRIRQAEQYASERAAHSLRAYGLATWLLTLLDQESEKHRRTSSDGVPKRSEDFHKELTNLNAEVKWAGDQFKIAANRSAQVRYARGMLLGMAGLAVLCTALGAAFLHWDVNAKYGIAFPAGGLGAIVSVLQRMNSGRLKIDFQGARDLLKVFGGVRPWIGAIFGVIIAAAIQGGLFPAISEPEGSGLAFYAVVGFLSGFNERFAQDMLSSSGKALTESPSTTEWVADDAAAATSTDSGTGAT